MRAIGVRGHIMKQLAEVSVQHPLPTLISGLAA
jgi:hypothetical protein